MRIFNVAIPAVALLATSIPAGASSCLLAQYEAIKLVPPQTCWVYEGRATHFTGVFRAGQHITVSMFGLEYAASGGSNGPVLLLQMACLSAVGSINHELLRPAGAAAVGALLGFIFR